MKRILIFLYIIGNVCIANAQINIYGKNFYKTSNLDSILLTGTATKKVIRDSLDFYLKKSWYQSDTINKTVTKYWLNNNFAGLPYSSSANSISLIDLDYNEEFVNRIDDNDDGGQNYIINNNAYQNLIQTNTLNGSQNNITTNNGIQNHIYYNYNKGSYIENNYSQANVVYNKSNTATSVKSVGTTLGDSIMLGGGDYMIKGYTSGANSFNVDRLGNINPNKLVFGNYTTRTTKYADYNLNNILISDTSNLKLTLIRNDYIRFGSSNEYTGFNGWCWLDPYIANSVNNVAFRLSTYNTLNSSGAKLFSLVNGTSEKFNVRYDGQVFANSFQLDTTATYTASNKNGLISYNSASSVIVVNSAIRLAASATVWEDDNLDPTVLTGTGNSPALINIGTSTVPIAAFDENILDEVTGHREIPHQCKIGSKIVFHLHGYPTNTNTGTVRMGLEYMFSIEGEASTTSTTIYLEFAANGTAWARQSENFAEIQLPNTIAPQFHFRIFRDATHVNDTYNTDFAISTIGYHYEIDGFGSNGKTTKDTE